MAQLQNPEPHEIEGGTTASPPRIVNGITVRPRKKTNSWRVVGLLLLPDFVLILILIGLGYHRLLRYLDARWPKESVPARPPGTRNS